MKKTFTKLLLFIVALFGAEQMHSQATLVSQFDFNGNLNDKLSVSTASLYNNASTTFSNGVFSFTANNTGEGGGLLLLVPDASFTEDNYSISLDFKVPIISGYRKIVDFKGQLDDDGFYYYDGNLDLFYTNDNSGPLTYSAGLYYTLLFTRSSADDTCRAYVIQNNTLVFDTKVKDVGLEYVANLVGANRVLGLFQNDTQGALGEFVDSASIRSVRIWNGIATFSNVCSSVVSKTLAPASGTICLGETLTVTCGGSPNTFTNYLYTPSVGSGTQVILSPTVTTNYTISGDYYATACAVPVNTFSVLVSPCTSLNEQTQQEELFTIYPNPFQQEIFVITSGEQQSIEVLDLLGSRRMLVQTTNEKTRLDLSELSNGVYFIRSNNVVKKIIKE